MLEATTRDFTSDEMLSGDIWVSEFIPMVYNNLMVKNELEKGQMSDCYEQYSAFGEVGQSTAFTDNDTSSREGIKLQFQHNYLIEYHPMKNTWLFVGFRDGACSNGCLYCKDANTCLVCQSGKTLFTDNTCMDCPTNCNGCEINGQATGVTCSAGSCATGYRNDGDNCSACVGGCTNCSDASTCTTCVSGTFLTNNNGTC